MLKFQINRLILLLALSIVFQACKNDKPLPILGQNHRIADFSFLSQDSSIVTNATFQNKIYVADFFFTSCPSICPKVSQQMLRIQDAYRNEDQLKMVSYSIDPKHDNPNKLKKYASKINADTKQWYFLTGDQDKTFELADNYWVAAFKDKDAPGGFDHSGKIILVDTDRRIRSFCDGTEPESVTRFIKDIKNLLQEVKAK